MRAASTPVDELTAGQLHGQDLVQRRDDLEVEAVQAFGRRELCGLDPALDHPAFALDQFQLAKPQQVVDVILVLHCALPGLFGIFAHLTARTAPWSLLGCKAKKVAAFGTMNKLTIGNACVTIASYD